MNLKHYIKGGLILFGKEHSDAILVCKIAFRLCSTKFLKDYATIGLIAVCVTIREKELDTFKSK
jgi:hypothetical protein